MKALDQILKLIDQLSAGQFKPSETVAKDPALLQVHEKLAALLQTKQQASTAFDFRSVFEASKDAIFIEDYNGTVLDVNAAGLELHQLPASELIGQNIFDTFPADIRAQAIRDFEALKTGKLSYLESSSYAADGSKISVGIKASKITFEGTPALLLIVRDISAREHTKEALQFSENRYRAFFESSHGLMCTHDLEGKILSINSAGAAMLNYRPDEIEGRSIRNLLSPEVKDQFEHYIEEINRKHISAGIMRIDTKDKEKRYWVYRNVLYSEGQEQFVIGSAVDITERFIIEKELEKAIQESAENIDKLNATLRELEQAKLEVEKSNRVKEEFIATMSHEIRTPLNAVIGFTDLLTETQLTGDQKEYLQIIRSSGDNLLAIINDILDFSKIEADMLALEFTAIDLEKEITDTFRLFEPKAQERNLSYSLTIEDTCKGNFIGDPYRLKQILINLINNALKFTETGFVKLAVSGKMELDTCLVRFEVSDSGIGMSKNQLETIFDSFVQADQSTTRKFGGTGLGLSIVKRLVELHQGSLSVDSKANQGTTFSIEIPYAVNASGEHGSLAENFKAISTIEQKLEILLVEDNLLNQRLAKQALESDQHQVSIANTGREAIQLVKQQSFDVILMDIHLPELDGVETTRFMRQVLKIETPIIALTARSFTSEIKHYLASGMNNHIAKPFRKHELLSKIEQTLQQKDNLTSMHMSQIDLSGLIDLSNNDVEFIREMLHLFKKQSPNNLTCLQKHLSEADFEALRLLAHKMRTSYNSLGIVQGSYLLEALENGTNKRLAHKNVTQLEQDLNALNQVTRMALTEIDEQLVRYAT